MGTTRIYELYPLRHTFSVKISDYSGTTYSVAAASIKQAFAVAHGDTWIDPNATHPVGVVAIYKVPTGLTLWCGCSGHDLTGGRVRHGVGVTALRAAIKFHDASCPNRVPSLRERLLSARRSAS
ncbi:hypothetical protein L2K20_29120 [Mycobacterium sp. MBM]|nr:hypothetical protein [Mycobacterium sp. MBM]